MGVKLGRRQQWKNIGWGCLRAECWGQYLGLRGTRWREWRKLGNESILISTLHQTLFRWPNQEERDGRGTGHVWETEEVHTGLWWGDLGEEDHLQDLSVDGRTRVNCILKEYYPKGVDWIDLAQDRDKWRAVVNAVTNLRVPWNAEHFFNSWGTVSFSGRSLLHGVSELRISEQPAICCVVDTN